MEIRDKEQIEDLKERNQLGCMQVFQILDQNKGEKQMIVIDMVHAYVNIFKPKVKTIKLGNSAVKQELENPVWWVTQDGRNVSVSPMDIITKPFEKGFEIHKKKILTALQFPIYLDKNLKLIDGYHRLAQKYSADPNAEFYTVNTIEISDAILKKCSIIVPIDSDVYLTVTNLIEMFYTGFCKKKK